MYNPITVKILADNLIYVKFADNTEGEISLEKVIKNNLSGSSNIYIHPESKNIIIADVELCKNAIYRQLQLKNQLKRMKIDIDKL